MTVPERQRLDFDIDWSGSELRWLGRNHYELEMRFTPKLIERAAADVADSLDYLRANVDGFQRVSVEWADDTPYTTVVLTLTSAQKLVAMDPRVFRQQVEDQIRAGVEKASKEVKADADAALPWLQAVSGIQRPRFGLGGRSR